MTSKILCGYCARWVSCKRVSNDSDNEEIPKKGRKKRKRKNKNAALVRQCDLTGKDVTVDSEACRYIEQKSNFFCQDYGYWVNYLVCLNRHRYKNRKRFEICQKCRQFEKEIGPIIAMFHIELPKKRIINRRKIKRIIKRRTSHPRKMPRIIKRRPVPRKIKRRKIPRIIKRRK